MPRRRAISPELVFADNRPELGGNIVKSAQRVLQVFELFNDFRVGATVADIATALKFPQSSASSLLRSLYTMGYLSFDPDTRTYCPTSRIALLGHWVDPLLVGDGPALKMARDVTERTGFNSFLATRNKLYVQIVHREFPPDWKAHSQIGSGNFVVDAATGHVLISDLPEREVTRLAVATNAQLPEGMERINVRLLLEKLAKVRDEGFAIEPTRRSGSLVTVAIRLPDMFREPIAFGVTAPALTIDVESGNWVGMLKAAVHTWLVEIESSA